MKKLHLFRNFSSVVHITFYLHRLHRYKKMNSRSKKKENTRSSNVQLTSYGRPTFRQSEIDYVVYNLNPSNIKRSKQTFLCRASSCFKSLFLIYVILFFPHKYLLLNHWHSDNGWTIRWCTPNGTK